MAMTDLLDPTNDYVFKRLFAEAPDLLVALINDLRPDLPNIEAVEILNPNIEPAELTGKYIILDVLAKDGAGHGYNVEVQVRRYDAWHKRGVVLSGPPAGHPAERRRRLRRAARLGRAAPAGLRPVHRDRSPAPAGHLAI
jgi:hypothetical protein